MLLVLSDTARGWGMRQGQASWMASTHQEIRVGLEVRVKDGHIVIVHQQLHALQKSHTKSAPEVHSKQPSGAATHACMSMWLHAFLLRWDAACSDRLLGCISLYCCAWLSMLLKLRHALYDARVWFGPPMQQA